MNNDLLNKNLIEEKNIVITLNSEGKTVEEAINNVFIKLRKDIYSKVEGYLVHMVPEKFIIKNYQVEEKIEKFLMFFLPQKRTKYILTAEVSVKVKFLRNIK
ncbi:DUF4312 family protein [Abyssisolibacter fermentans]|uniref:DUF4312 family protein n=1 Tax=Abyssisolibacter fermentans TaxID=1766203 RepID=UPI000832AC2B|nr:DUF4312 family protein [Abyssisolibacter fermentans]